MKSLGPKASIWREGIKLGVHLSFLSFPWQIYERRLELQGLGDEKGSFSEGRF
jgi:hypothetical protein